MATIRPGVQNPHCRGGMLQELLLHRMQLVALGDALDRGDRRALGFHAQHQAGTDQTAVHDDRAGAAVAGCAAFLAAGQADHVAQHIQQGLLGFAEEFGFLAVDGGGNVSLGHGQ